MLSREKILFVEDLLEKQKIVMNRDPSFQIYPVDGSNCQVLFRGRQCGVILPTAGLCSPSKILPSAKKMIAKKLQGEKISRLLQHNICYIS